MNIPTQLTQIDPLLQRFPEKDDFVEYTQTPRNQEALREALRHLVDSWPTTEQLEELETFFTKGEKGSWRMVDKAFYKSLKKVRDDLSANAYVLDGSGEELAAVYYDISAHRPYSNDTILQTLIGVFRIDYPLVSSVYSITKRP